MVTNSDAMITQSMNRQMKPHQVHREWALFAQIPRARPPTLIWNAISPAARAASGASPEAMASPMMRIKLRPSALRNGREFDCGDEFMPLQEDGPEVPPNALHMCCGRGGGASDATQQALSTGGAGAAELPAADSTMCLLSSRVGMPAPARPTGAAPSKVPDVGGAAPQELGPAPVPVMLTCARLTVNAVETPR